MNHPNYPYEAVIGADMPSFVFNPEVSPGTSFTNAPYVPAPGNADVLTPVNTKDYGANPRADVFLTPAQYLASLRQDPPAKTKKIQDIGGDQGGNPNTQTASMLRELVLVVALTAPVWGTFLLLRLPKTRKTFLAR